MNILNAAREVMTDGVITGTAGLKLIAHIDQMTKSQDAILKIYENMTEAYATNMTYAVGQEGMVEVIAIYTDIKTCREALKAKGI